MSENKSANPIALENYSDAETDYVMNPKVQSVWIRVGNISVYLKQLPTGIQIETLPLGCETDEAITSQKVTFVQASRSALRDIPTTNVKAAVSGLKQLGHEHALAHAQPLGKRFVTELNRAN